MPQTPHLRRIPASICFHTVHPDTIKNMEASVLTAARRTEDIALDLLKFVASHANIGNKSSGSTGFVAPSATKPEDQVTSLLDLYARCREAVEAPLDK